MLVVGPLPPPLGGVQLMNEMLVGSSLARDFEIECLNTSKGALRWAVEKQSWRSLVDFVRHAARLVARLARFRPAIVYVHAASGISFTRDWALMAIARLSGAKVVCHYHGTLHTVFPSVRTAFGRACGRVMMGAAHRVIVLGPTYRDAFANAWRRDDVVWSANLVDLAPFAGLSHDARPEWLFAGEKAVLFMGRLSAPKGLGELLDAMPRVLERHPEARFVLCGVAETEAQEPMVRADVARRGLASRVTFLGSLEGRAKARAYVTSRVFVSPSWTEAFPLVVPECAAAGLPMVITRVGAIPDYVKDGEDGFLIAPHDAGAVADAVNRLLDDDALCARIGGRLRERAAREFAVEVGAARVRGVLDDVLGSAARGVQAPAARRP
ncbi:MAG TPA: glycosyltransferase [Candidatus Saccharimonadaceae bacterium]|jgi:glycosyltransferase involved in cell wall biosynthesis|nr:glycosyltransferase [Candidatus Saccharimonadaceae bacterium]